MVLERLYYFDPFSNIIISCDVHCKGSEETVKSNLKKAIESFEAFETAVSLNEENCLQYENINFRINSENISFSQDDDLSILKRLSAHPFDLENGETLKVIARKERFGYTVYFCMHHIVGDANSLIMLIKSFAKIMTGKEGKIALADEKAEKNIALDAQTEYLINSINRHSFKDGYTREDFLKMQRKLFEENNPIIEKKVVDENELEDLILFCKKENVSLTAHLVNEVFENRDVETVCLPTDTREKENTFGNFVGRIDIKRKDLGKITDNAERLKKIGAFIKNRLKNKSETDKGTEIMRRINPEFFDDVIFGTYTGNLSPFTKRMAKIIGFKDEKATSFVSNLKKVEFERKDDFYITNTCFYPPHPTERFSTVGVVTQDNQMIITVQRYK